MSSLFTPRLALHEAIAVDTGFERVGMVIATFFAMETMAALIAFIGGLAATTLQFSKALVIAILCMLVVLFVTR